MKRGVGCVIKTGFASLIRRVRRHRKMFFRYAEKYFVRGIESECLLHIQDYDSHGKQVWQIFG